MQNGPDSTWFAGVYDALLKASKDGGLDPLAAKIEGVFEGAEWIRVAEEPVAELPKAPASVEVPAVALAVNQKQAAALLGVHVDTFRDKVLPHLKVVTLDRRQLIPIRELERFMTERQAYALRSQR